MSNRIDTDQLLDRCADCGARPKIVSSWELMTTAIQCTECANSTGQIPSVLAEAASAYAAAIIWNKEQRQKKTLAKDNSASAQK